MDNIESSLLQGEQCLVVNLDIQAAFDCLNNYSIIKAMRERNFPINIIGWYQQFLFNRISKTEINGIKSAVIPTKGTPQGSILALLCWNLVFDSFLKDLNYGPIKARSYADDASKANVNTQ